MAGKSIEAILSLNITQFETGLNSAKSAVNNFKNSLMRWEKDAVKIESGIEQIRSALSMLIPYLNKFKNLVEQSRAFSQFTNGLKNMATAVRDFSNVTSTSQVGMIRIKQIIDQWSNAVRNLRVSVDGAVASEQREANTLNQLRSSYQSTYMAKERMIVPTQQYARALEIALPPTRQLITGNRELASSENQVASSTEKASASMNRGSASASRMASTTSRLGKAMSSLRMMGTMVGSMLAYNFAHNLAMATNETIQSKSEMEGYFKMLNYGQSDIQKFNDALDQTVQRFQRVNKYSLGETISSIGVEFNLTTDEMIKAMDVTSMITSEYLRAGRNANEASLAVKDVLQGQFQRLSRETGVKGEQLKEAGWNGDVNDVNSLLDALRKVAEDRNWDVFAEKANSLNDIVTITQNRFGEWSADMVNAVQPAIVNAFNSIMSFSQGVAQGLSSLWKWLNTDGWGQTAVKIGMVATAVMTLMPLLTAWRSGSNLLQVANMSLTQSLGALVFGLNAEALATSTTSDAIATKLLGITAEQLEETTLVGVINGMIASRTAEAGATALATESNLGFIGGLTAMITGETIAEGTTIGLTGALGLLTGAFLASPIGWFTLALLGLASAFYVLSGGLDSSWDEMKKFNETMQNAGEEQKKAQQYLADLKKEVGENSQAYKDAEESVKNWKSELQSASYWMNDATKKFEEMNLRMSASSKPILKDMGLDEKEIEKFDASTSHLILGKNKYYKAEQVLNAQLYNEHSNYNEDLKSYLKDVQANGGDLNEAYEKMYGNYMNLAEHSYIANTTDDWWEWMWNSLYAGMDQFWIDWDKFWADPNWEGAINGLWRGLKTANPFGGILKNLGLDNFDLGKVLNDFSSQMGKVFDGKTLMDLLGLDPNTDYIGDFFNWLSDSFWNSVNGFIDSLSGGGSEGNGMKKIDIMSFLKGLLSLGDSVDFSWATDFINNYVITPISTAWNNFMADPLGTIGGLVATFSMGGLVSALMGTDVLDFSWAWEYVNNNIIMPLATTIQMFMADPVAFIGEMGFTISGLLDRLFGTDIFSQVWNWTNQYIIQPFGTAMYNGILSIPIVGDIIQLLGFTDQAHGNASLKGDALAQAFQRAVEDKVRNIPILGDILQFLGVIPQANPTANANGHGVGQNISSGTKSGMGNLGQLVLAEFNDALSGIGQLGQQAYNTARNWANQLWEGVNSILQRHSPGFFHDQFKAEFGTDIPNAIESSGETAYATAQSYAQNIKQGIADAGTTTIGMDGMVSDYESDAQIISDSSQMMGMTTTTAFNDMALSVNSTTSQMGGNVVSSYTAMNTSQTNLLNNMKQKNTSAYNDMYLKSNQSLTQMRDSTSNITHQMTNAWNTMKNNIVASAQKLKSDSTVHFNTLSNTIGGFYRKIQKPSSWGGSPHGGSTHRNVTAGRRFASTFKGGRYAGGRGSTYDGRNTMTIAQLKKKICPNGDCDGIFDGWSPSDVVDVRTFLSLVETGGFGSWGDWHNTHYSHIKNKSDAWSMKSPTIQLKGGIPTNADYKVGDFESGSLKISFSAFQSMAESIYSAIPYRFYYNSDWKGSWLGALQAGACNCYDGANSLIAFASACGFGGSRAHGTWVDPDGTTYPHVWAVINGKKMDTTAWQQRGSWSAGSPTVRSGNPSTYNSNNSSTSVNVTVTIEGDVYGVDDLDSKIAEGVDKGLSKHFNKSYAIGV